jgi:hypothetical protein
LICERGKRLDFEDYYKSDFGIVRNETMGRLDVWRRC